MKPFSIPTITFQVFTQALRQSIRFPWRGTEILQQINLISFESLPIVVIATAFAGLVVSSEIAWHMNLAVNSIALAPGFTGQFILRELAVAIPALLVVSKVGASMTAEIALMKQTEQLDALKLLHIQLSSYLIFPRWVGTMVSLVFLTIASIWVTLLCSLLSATLNLGFGALEYINILRPHIHASDLMMALVKSLVFGCVIPLISCAYGLGAKAGAEGIGEATTQSVVTSTVTIIFLDFVIGALFK